jgi:peptide/nickel transport system permease protein
MVRFLASRLLQATVSFLVVALFIFIIMRMSGNGVEMLLDEGATQEMRDRLIERFGLADSYPIQFLRYIGAVAIGDFGTSMVSGRAVSELIGRALFNTAVLSVVSMALALVVAIPAGVYSAIHAGSRFDRAARLFSVLGQSAPAFVTAIILILVFSVWLRLLPTSGIGGPSHMILPACTLAWYIASGIIQITRTSMLEVMRADYITLAKAKGVRQVVVIWKHAFKNAALPVTTFSAILFINLLSGSVVAEAVFAWPGLGLLLIDSVVYRDFPVVQAIVLLISAMFLAINLMVDIVYAFLNPRIRLHAAG